MIKITRRTALIAGLAAPVIARAQGFPTRPLRLVVPFPPAGAADITLTGRDGAFDLVRGGAAWDAATVPGLAPAHLPAILGAF